MDKIAKNIRKGIAALEPYTCARDLYKTAESFMDANENSFGSSIPNVEGVALNRYPDSDQNELRDEIAKYAGVKRENVLVGNGSDEIIDLCVRAFVEMGENVISLEPGYSMYGVCAKSVGAGVKKVPLDGNFQPDIEAVAKATDEKTKIIFLVSPNSPVGVQVEPKLIEGLAIKTGSMLFVDEAYIEFGGQSAAKLVEKYENLIVSRTFSKAWGLAGLRVGYMIANKKVIALLRKLKSPYNVNSLSASLAAKALKSGRSTMEGNLVKMRNEREKMRNELASLGFFVYPSVCNFLLARPPLCAKTAPEMQKEIAAKGMIIRDRSTMPMLQNTFRITIGTQEENRKLMDYVREIVKAGGDYDSVLFDMDGVLVDVSKSYRVAIEKTANWYIEKTKAGSKVTQANITSLKTVVGFNNDWDVTYALVKALKQKTRFEDARPLSQAERKGDVYAKLKEKFQGFYLNGLIQAEVPLVSPKTLDAIVASGKKLGIVTSRPREEAKFAIKNNSWEKYFNPGNIVAQEDCSEEKPSPKPVLAAIEALGAKRPVYVGDSSSDYAACVAAKVPCVIVGQGAKGDWNIERADDILAIIRGR